MKTLSISLLLILATALPLWAENAPAAISRDRQLLAAYSAQIQQLRQKGHPTLTLPGPKFFLFGMGARSKFIYRNGELVAWPSGRVLRKWNVREEVIVPPSYSVWINTDAGTVHIYENESGTYIEDSGKRTTLARRRVSLPKFDGEQFSLVLRVLHQEILVNIVDGKPVPNFLVYPKPWYRDGAMMAMVLRKTGNIRLIHDWILSLREPYDHNNWGNSEPDNLGEVLYLISCVSDSKHPLVPQILEEAKRLRVADYINGKTDGGDHPVYQTKWLKFGLHSLGLPDEYVIPKTPDGYSSLFWWDFGDGQIGPEFDQNGAMKYPYLAWARDHLTSGHSGYVAAGLYPLTWEADASQANYSGMSVISTQLTDSKTAAPHTWHAAEMFLALASDKTKY